MGRQNRILEKTVIFAIANEEPHKRKAQSLMEKAEVEKPYGAERLKFGRPFKTS